jgi:hypothetical protein
MPSASRARIYGAPVGANNIPTAHFECVGQTESVYPVMRKILSGAELSEIDSNTSMPVNRFFCIQLTDDGYFRY